MSKKHKSLYIIEDNLADTVKLMRLLDEIPHEFGLIDCATTVSDAMALFDKKTPDCCILDYSLPDGSAIDFLEKLYQKEGRMQCPIAVVTGQDDAQTAVKLLNYGAQDYLVKEDLNKRSLEHVINKSIRTWERDQEVKYLALHDSLTGLVNRTLLQDRLNLLFEESKRYQRNFAVMYIDLDRFKGINDTHGHEAGDHVLVQTAKRLKELSRRTDTVARLGGDEFAVLLPSVDEESVHTTAFKFVAGLSQTLVWNDSTIDVKASIGVALHPGEAESFQDLLSHADYALYHAKKNGRAQYATYNESMATQTRQLFQLSNALPEALKEHDLSVMFQPIFDHSTNQLSAVEALVRWRHERADIESETIIDLMLKRHLSDEFHQWLFSHTLSKLASLHESHPELSLNLNLPASLCRDPKLCDALIEAIQQHNIDPQRIMVEVAESQLMKDPDQTLIQFQKLSNEGVTIAIDDFGAGFSSMQYLARLPCSQIKIDKSFFIGIDDEQRNPQVIRGMVELAHSLGLKVVAEGIESQKLLKLAVSVGCDFVQGYYLGGPARITGDLDNYLQEAKREGEVLLGNEA